MPHWMVGAITAGSSKAAIASAMPSGASKVSGVPQSPQKPRQAWFDDWKFFGAPRVQVELGAAHRDQRLIEIAAGLLAHAAMADRRVAERALDAEAHRAALAAA